MSEIVLEVVLPQAARLDKALAAALPEEAGLSRSRLRGLIKAGAVSVAGAAVTDPSAKVAEGARAVVRVPPLAPAREEAEAIPLAIVHEDEDIVVIDKPPGLVVHPAPGAPTGTLVNALLHHCGDRIAGVGAAGRPGIVHRIDKDTSGLIVVAKSEAAHGRLSALFKAHDVEREYRAIVWGVPDPADPRLGGLVSAAWEPGGVLRIDAAIGRHATDRKRMAVRQDGRRAVTRVRVLERYGRVAAMVACRLETGRTHQIRVHLAHIGHPLVGDPAYGRGRKAPGGLPEALAAALAGFGRQALHAAVLGFRHPRTGSHVRWEAEPPADFTRLSRLLGNQFPRSEL